jgi:hypothetical protein
MKVTLGSNRFLQLKYFYHSIHISKNERGMQLFFIFMTIRANSQIILILKVDLEHWESSILTSPA